MQRTTRLVIILITLLIIQTQLFAQVSFSQNHPELRWETFETDHFKIIYHQGIETLANEVALVAEEVYGPITSDLGVTLPQKTPILVTDYLDYSNGLSTPLGHYIVIWAKSETKYMTGQIKWLRAVVAHEFAHLVVFRGVRAFPGFWRELLALGFVPTWFLEGVAEYESEPWCEHREMLMRVVAYHRKLLPYKKMTGFIGADEIGSRLVYEQGHSIIRFISARYGPDAIARIIQKYRSLPISFNLTLKRTIGVSENELFRMWKKEADDHYHRTYEVHTPIIELSKKVATPFQGNYGARWSPDGKKIAIVGIKKYEEGISELYLLDTFSGKIQKVAGPYVNSYFSWSPDGKRIVFSQQHRVRTGAAVNDLFILNTATLRIDKLTDHERATDPHWSPDGQRIVYVVHQGSHSNLAIFNIPTRQRQMITDFSDWTEVFSPCWSPDGKQIAFSLWDYRGFRDIALIQPDGANFRQLTEDAIDDRDPVWSPDGKRLNFISYRNGIPNLHLVELADGKIRRITDTPGGVFNPTWLPDGTHLAVIAFENRDTTDIVILPNESNLPPLASEEKPASLSFHAAPEHIAERTAFHSSKNALSPAIKSYRSLSNIRSQIFLPFADQNEKGWQPGVIYLAADPLGKHTLMTALTYRDRIHFSVDYENRQFAPTIGLNVAKTTIDHGGFLRLFYKDGSSRVLPLYENFWSGSLSLYWNINSGKSLLSDHLLWLRFTATYRNIINQDDFENINTGAWAYPLLQGWTNYLTAGYVWQSYRPNISDDIHPGNGASISVFGHHADSWLGSELRFSQIGMTVVFRRELPLLEHVIALRAGVSFRNGNQPIQNRLALGNNSIRGAIRSVEGDQQLFANLEYRFPLIRDAGLKIWIFYFEQFCGALFFDSGKAWGNNLIKLDQKRYRHFPSTSWLSSTGFELRHRIYFFGKIPFVFSGGYAIPLSDRDSSDFYFQIGSIF